MSGKDLLLAAAAFDNVTPVAIPEVPKLDGKIFVRVLTAGERQLFVEAQLQAREQGTLISDYEIVAICACEADGTPMFHNREANGQLKIRTEDLAKLVNVDGRAVAAIAVKGLEVSGITAKADEEAKKNSSVLLNGASSSDSPVTSNVQ